MDIIKSSITNKYIILEDLIKESEDLSYDDSLNILHLFFYMHVNNYIDDNQVFSIFYLIIVNRGIKLENIMYLCDYLRKKNIGNKIQYYIRILRDIYLKEMEINNTIIKLKESDGYINFSNLNMDNYNTFFYDEIHFLIHSFSNTSFIDIPPMFPKYKQIWMEILEEEIFNRLCQLVKLFGYKLLKTMNVPLITAQAFNDLPFDQKITYYRDCVKKLEFSFNLIIETIVKKEKLDNINHNFINYYKNITSNNNNIIDSLVSKYFQ